MVTEDELVGVIVVMRLVNEDRENEDRENDGVSVVRNRGVVVVTRLDKVLKKNNFVSLITFNLTFEFFFPLKF